MLFGLVDSFKEMDAKAEENARINNALSDYADLLANGCLKGDLSHELVDKVNKMAEDYDFDDSQLISAQRSAVKSALDEMINDGGVDEEDYHNFRRLLRMCTGISDSEVRGYERKAKRYHTFYEIAENHHFPVYVSSTLPIQLKKDEKIHYVCGAEIIKKKTITKGVFYSGPSVSFKICKGVRYRAGYVSAVKDTEDVWVKEDEGGYFWISSVRVGYLGKKRAFSVPIDKIMSINGAPEGLLIFKEGRESPYSVNLTIPRSEYDMPLVILSTLINLI